MTAAVALHVCVGDAYAQAQPLRQMDHRAWTVRDGAPQVISELALDRRDGTLWIGSDGGLFNFDGLTFRPYQSPPGQPEFPVGQVSSLLVTRTGAIWVGIYESGVARISGDRVTVFNTIGAEPLKLVEHLQEASDGTIWATGDRRLIRFGPSDAEWHRESAPPSAGVSGFLIDSTNTLWLAQDGLLYRRPLAQPSYEPTGVPADAIVDFVETPGGEIWINDYDVATAQGRTQLVSPAGQRVRVFQPNPFTEGRTAWAADGSLILASSRGGVRRLSPHVSPLRTDDLSSSEPDVFLREHGLSSNTTRALAIDAHGNIWIGGLRGLDRLKPARLTRHSPGAEASGWAVCGSQAGQVWVANTRGDLHPVFTNAPQLLRVGGSPLYSIACANDGHAWFANSQGVWAIASGTISPLPPIGGGIGRQPIRVLATTNHTLYAAVAASSFHHDGGIWQFRNGVWSKLPRDGELGLGGYAAYLDRRDRLWIGYTKGRAMLHTAAGAQMFTSGDPGLGYVHAFIETSRGLFAAGTNGLAVLRGSTFNMLAFAEPSFARGVRGLVEALNGDLWLNSAGGFTQVPARELESGVADATYPIKARLIREGDVGGAGAPQGVITYLDTAARDAEGRLWFATRDGVVHLDPERRSDGPPPVVTIRSMRADGQPMALDRVIGPAARTLAIEYVGVNLSAPEHVVYRYRLEGLDESWQEAGRRREVVFTRLSPGTYTFSVMASNGDGVWTAPVSAAPFTVRPSFYQTQAFAATIVGLVVLAAGLVHRVRVRQISRIMSARFDERTRVARDLHDTILQTVHGSRMVAEHALKHPADHHRMVQTMQQVAAWLAKAAEEGRTALNVLRGSAIEANDLTEAIRRASDECRSQGQTAITVEAGGEPAEMYPAVQDEIYRIAHEAIRNACMHSGGDRIEIKLSYGADFTLRVGDNGTGIAPDVIDHGRVGHFGLRGMQERAERIGGKLAIRATPGTGTTVTLVVPGSLTYRKL
jgi:signal transduction histidine kinase/ligand-binding sensor domain-containing protein